MNLDAIIRLSSKSESAPPQSYEVFYVNGVKIGEFYMEVDGFYVYEPVNRNGYMSEHVLLALGMKLQELNAEWDETIRKEVGSDAN